MTAVNKMRLIVHGIPASQGSKKFVGRTKEGRGILADASKRTKPWRRDVMDAAISANLRVAGPVRLGLAFTFPRPKSLSSPKKAALPHSVKPDVSKLARAVEDALVEAGVIDDDARIQGYDFLEKFYPGQGDRALDRPGVLISIAAFGQPEVAAAAVAPAFAGLSAMRSALDAVFGDLGE